MPVVTLIPLMLLKDIRKPVYSKVTTLSRIRRLLCCCNEWILDWFNILLSKQVILNLFIGFKTRSKYVDICAVASVQLQKKVYIHRCMQTFFRQNFFIFVFLSSKILHYFCLKKRCNAFVYRLFSVAVYNSSR